MPNPTPDTFNAQLEKQLSKAGISPSSSALDSFKQAYQDHYDDWVNVGDDDGLRGEAQEKLSAFIDIQQYIADIQRLRKAYPNYSLSFSPKARINAYLAGCSAQYPEIDHQKIQAGRDTLQSEKGDAKTQHTQKQAQLAQAKRQTEEDTQRQRDLEAKSQLVEAQQAAEKAKTAAQDQTKCDALMKDIKGQYVKAGLLNHQDVQTLEALGSGPFKTLEAALKKTLITKIEQQCTQFITPDPAKKTGLALRGAHNIAISTKKPTPALAHRVPGCT